MAPPGPPAVGVSRYPPPGRARHWPRATGSARSGTLSQPSPSHPPCPRPQTYSTCDAPQEIADAGPAMPGLLPDPP